MKKLIVVFVGATCFLLSAVAFGTQVEARKISSGEIGMQRKMISRQDPAARDCKTKEKDLPSQSTPRGKSLRDFLDFHASSAQSSSK